MSGPQTHVGKDLFVEHDDVVVQELAAQASERNLCCIGQPAWETHCLTGPQQMRLKAYRENAHCRRLGGAKRVSANASDGWIADLDQNEEISRLFTGVPTLLTHGVLWCEAPGHRGLPGISRPAMKHEYLSFQAFCLFLLQATTMI